MYLATLHFSVIRELLVRLVTFMSLHLFSSELDLSQISTAEKDRFIYPLDVQSAALDNFVTASMKYVAKTAVVSTNRSLLTKESQGH